MDVVQKVQNVLKSALDKPPTLTGSIPKIPEHANVEWSNILPSILSGETDAILPGGEFNQLARRPTTEKTAALNVGMSATSKAPTRKPPMVSSGVQNAYGGFANNNVPQEKKPTEKPMIPVPVITLTEQKLSTLQSAVTESPIFQMLSVIPVETAESDHKQTVSSATSSTTITRTTTTTTTERSQTEHFVEVTLTEVPEATTLPQLTSSDTQPVNVYNITKNITNLNDTVDEAMTVPLVYHSIATPSVSSSTELVPDMQKIVTFDVSSSDEAITSVTDDISSSSAGYVVTQSKNNTYDEDSLFVSGVTTESQVSATYDTAIPQTNATTSKPLLSHASVPLKSDHDETSSLVFSASGAPEASTQHAANQLGENFMTVTKESLSSSVMPYTATAHRDSQPTTEIQPPIEPLPTQLIDSLSSVMSQVSEVRPPVLSLPANEMMPIDVNVDHDGRRNVSDQTVIADTQHDALTFHDTNEEHVASTKKTHTTVPTEALLPVVTVRPVDSTVQQSSAITADRESIANVGISEIPPSAKITTTTASIEAMNNDMAIDNSAATSEKVSVQSTVTTSTTQKIPNVSSPASQTIETTATDAALEKHAVDETTSTIAKTSSTASTLLDVAETTQSTTTALSDESSSKSTPTSEIFQNTFAKLNLSNPVSAVDQILKIAPLPSSTPSVEPIALPTHASNLAPGDLASGLIAGFATSTSSQTSSNKESNGNQATTNASINSSTMRPTISSDVTMLAEGIKSTAQMYKENGELEKNDDQKKRNATQTAQASLLTDSVTNDTLKEESNNDTTEAIKLSTSSERIDDSTTTSSSSLPDTFATTTEEIVTASSAKPSTTSNIQLSNANKTLPSGESNDRKKPENNEKIKTTEASVVIRTDVSPESQLPVKVALIDPADANNNTRHSVNVSKHEESNAKTKNQTSGESLVANISSTTEKAPHSALNNFNSELHKNISSAFNVTFNTAVANKNSSDSSSQNLNITETNFKDNHTIVQSNKNDNSSLSSQKDKVSIIKPIAAVVDTQKLSGNASENKQELSKPSLSNNTNNSNSVNNVSSQNKKPAPSQNTTQNTTTIGTNVSGSSMKNGSINGQLPNKTESKPASLKHSESPKPEVTRVPSSTTPPVRQMSRPTVGHKPAEKPDVVSTTDTSAEDKWTLITQQVPPKLSKPPRPPSRKPPPISQTSTSSSVVENNRFPEATQDQQESSTQSVQLDASQSASGLDVTVSRTSADIVNFAKLCNELAFNFWVATNKGLSTARSLALSPFGMTSLLAMIFLGARGPTSDQMNEVLGLDDVATFNPHLVFQNITDTVSLARGQGIANAAFVRELFADKMKVRKLMPFYKEQAQQFYEGLVTEVNFATISDLVRRRTNLLIRKQTGGRIKDFVKTSTIPLRSPLAALSANVFQTDCNNSLTSSVGRDGELYFAVSPAVRQRKLIPVPATTWRSGVLAGYEPSIDATAIALGGSDKLVSTIFVLPGQQGHTAPGDTLDRLEQRLVRSAFRDNTWTKLLKVLIPRNSLELQVPKFSHRSVINATAALKRMGLDELFSGNADFKGINGIGHRLYLADVLQVSELALIYAINFFKKRYLFIVFANILIVNFRSQMNLFSTCGDENVLNGRHHVETYPATPLRRNVKRHMEVIDDPANISEEDAYSDVSSIEDFYREERQTSGSEKPKLKLDRPFLYFVRHNPSGIILHMGRFNPRLLS